MSPSFFQPPAHDTYVLRNLRAPLCLLKVDAAAADRMVAFADGHGELVAIDLRITHGRIDAIAPAGSFDGASGPDLDASMVLPGMVDVHTHLDKGHIWPRQPNPTGDGAGA